MIAALLLLCVQAPSAPPASAGAGAEELFLEARRLLEADNPGAAEAKAMEGLALDPWAVTGYEVLHAIAAARDDDAGRLRWGKWLFWAHDYAGRAKEAAAVAAQLAAIWEGADRDGAIVRAWRESALKAARGAAAAGQFQAAGHLMGKLLDLDPADAALASEYDKLVEKGGQLVSGGSFVAERVRRRSPQFLERQNRLHADWERAFTRKTPHYEVITNVSYAFFETLCVVMEDMHQFYRKVYGYTKTSPRLELHVYRKRSDFDQFSFKILHESLPLGVLGWFYWEPRLMVAAYDPTEAGTDLRDLWNTLFHEASHQFMHLYTKSAGEQPPTWLNEGTASYFEGCELKADGSIVKNKPAKLRILEWEALENSSARHSLADLINCPHSAYDGTYYSYGWSLVYFLNNYEDKNGNFIYREPYLRYLQSYTRKGGDAPLARAKRMFVEEVADPDVPDWDAFERRWRNFTRDVLKESQAGPDLATVLQERARRYLERGDAERALLTAEQADEKRPDDAETFLLLARASDALGRRPEAAYWMLRHWEAAWAAEDEERLAAAEKWLREHDGEALVKLFCQPSRQALAQTEAAMDAAVEAGHPVLAMLFAQHALQAFGVEHGGLRARIASMGELSGHDVRLWRRVMNRTPENNRKLDGKDWVKFELDGILFFTPQDRAWTWLQVDDPGLQQLEPPFDLRGTVEIDGPEPALIELGVNASGRPQAGLDFENGAKITFVVWKEEAREDQANRLALEREDVGELRLTPMARIPFLLLMKPDGKGELSVGDQFKTELPARWTRDVLTGGMGIGAGSNTAALFSGLEVRPHRPFWPVPPREEEG